MCGHVGIAGNLEHKDEKTFQRLLLFDYFRGPDSTGIASVKYGGDCRIVKMASHPLDLFDSKRYGLETVAAASSAFIGHNRAATKGAVNGNNAHPFIFGDIVGCHNGTLSHWSWKDLEKKLGEEYDVDSAALIASIERFGIEETLASIEGAWSLVWYDKKDFTLNFIRNKERPMFFAYTETFDKLLWASEWPTIQAATKLSPQEYKLYISEAGYSYFATELDTLYSFNLKELRDKAVTALPDAKKGVYKGKEPAPVKPTNPHFPFVGKGHGTTTASTTSMTKSLGSHKGGVGSAVLSFPGTNEDPFAGQISFERFEELALYGCSYCSASVDYADVGITIFDRDDILICPSCSTDPTINRIVRTELVKVA